MYSGLVISFTVGSTFILMMIVMPSNLIEDIFNTHESVDKHAVIAVAIALSSLPSLGFLALIAISQENYKQLIFSLVCSQLSFIILIASTNIVGIEVSILSISIIFGISSILRLGLSWQ